MNANLSSREASKAFKIVIIHEPSRDVVREKHSLSSALVHSLEV